ncbi:MAG: AAA family ATPase [Anaerolineales bacterium]|nr:MAG: AAA family ATPase [Anaerolineales bacterium]
MTSVAKRQRIPTGIPGLDSMLGGGLLETSAVLVSGAPGVGKTTLGMQYLVNGAQLGQPGLLVTFEEFPATLIRDAKAMGWDLRALEAEGKLRMLFTSPEVLVKSLQSPDSPLSETVRNLAPRRVVIDSMAHFLRFATDPVELRHIFNTLVNALKREGMTSLLLDEATRLLGAQYRQSGSLPFVVDAILLMRYVEVDSAMQRAIAILKMRGSAHASEIRGYSIGQGGIKIGEPFKDREGILSGSPHRVS